jgi:probable rRNA maturation factor
MDFPELMSSIEDISFHQEEVSLPINEVFLRNWLIKIAKKHYKVIGEVQYIFCNDAYLQTINWKYLKHKSLTDIITFQYDHTKYISADIYISVDMVKANANKFNVTYEEELLRVIIHGLLHCIGFKDKNELDEKIMRKEEEESIFKFIEDYGSSGNIYQNTIQ